MSSKTNKGFTLIELLVVIAIIAVLSIVVILTLNPAELLRQARDSNRISDMATLKSAISLFLADVSTSSAALGDYTKCYVDVSGVNGTSSCSSWFTAATLPATVQSTTLALSRSISGTGWIPINFNAISSGAPIGQLPIDPLDNDKTHFYSYRPTSTMMFKIAANMESAKYSNGGGASDIESTDGGANADMYETGTNLGL
jgi:prepilin-type N-terminal cleavage/methylation domain-containing protein